MTKGRNYNIDFLRIFACIMVVLLHVSSQEWYNAPVTSFEWKILNFYDTAVRGAVPLFFMISGKLFLEKEELDVRSLLLKNAVRLALLYFVWSFLYAVDKIGLHAVLLEFNLRQLLTKTLESQVHLWFLPSMVSVYLLTPILYGLKNVDNGKYLKYILALFLVFEVLRPTVLAFTDSSSLKTLLKKFDFSMEEYCGYFVLGYVLDQKLKEKILPKKRYLIGALLAVIVLTAILGDRISVMKGKPFEAIFGKFFLSSFVEACILFAVFTTLPEVHLSGRMAGVVKAVSKYTLFVYLAHPFFLSHLKLWFGVTTLSFNPILSVPVITIGIFVLCQCIAWIIDRIPLLNRILM